MAERGKETRRKGEGVRGRREGRVGCKGDGGLRREVKAQA